MHVEHTIVRRTAARHRQSEDSHLIAEIKERPFFVVVADGHGLPLYTETTQHLALKVVTEFGSLFIQNPDVQAFGALCEEVQMRIEKEFKKIPVGAVATCVAVGEQGITIAQVGDCVVLKFTPNDPFSVNRLTQDHSPDHPGEIQRLRPFYRSGIFEPLIRQKGNFSVTRILCKKTGMTAAFSRSFGDPDFRPIVTHEPEVQSIDYTSNDELYAICSDGGEGIVRNVFRRLKNECVPMNESFMAVVARFAQESTPLQPSDDITIIFFRVMRFSPVP